MTSSKDDADWGRGGQVPTVWSGLCSKATQIPGLAPLLTSSGALESGSPMNWVSQWYMRCPPWQGAQDPLLGTLCLVLAAGAAGPDFLTSAARGPGSLWGYFSFGDSV